jgi:hypothetical protein
MAKGKSHEPGALLKKSSRAIPTNAAINPAPNKRRHRSNVNAPAG